MSKDGFLGTRNLNLFQMISTSNNIIEFQLLFPAGTSKTQLLCNLIVREGFYVHSTGILNFQGHHYSQAKIAERFYAHHYTSIQLFLANLDYLILFQLLHHCLKYHRLEPESFE